MPFFVRSILRTTVRTTRVLVTLGVLGALVACATEAESADSTEDDLTKKLPKPIKDPDDPWGYGAGGLIDPWKSDPATYGFTSPPGDVAGLPGEFEPTDELLLSTGAPGDHGFNPEWAPFFSGILAGAAKTGVAITLLDPQLTLNVKKKVADGLLASAHLDASAVERLGDIPVDTVWMRDYGPLVVRTKNGGRRVIDARYLLQDDYGVRYQDDAVPTRLAASHWKNKDWPVSRPPIMLEGGFVQSDGQGACVTTSGLIDYNSWIFPYSKNDIASIFTSYLGCKTTTFVTSLKGEATGHLDILATITGPKKALVGSYDPSQDAENAKILDDDAQTLEAAGFHVDRVPMPDNAVAGQSWKSYRTYTNALALAGPKASVVLVPVYKSDTKHQAAALAAFATAYPGREIIPIDASIIFDENGAIHCTTMSIPK